MTRTLVDQELLLEHSDPHEVRSVRLKVNERGVWVGEHGGRESLWLTWDHVARLMLREMDGADDDPW